MTAPRHKSRRRRLKRGPRILGYEPGWLWLILTLIVMALGIGIVVRGIDRHQASIEELDALIMKHAQQQDLPVDLVRAVVQAESGGDANARSEANARGLMQVTPVTHQDVRQRFDMPDGNLYDPDYNLRVGTTYLRYLLDRFEKDTTLALAAYHMGPTRVARHLRQSDGLTSRQLVEKHGGPKTRAYVKRILEELES